MTADAVDRPVVRPDQVTLRVLISQVSREEVDAAIEVCGVTRHDPPPRPEPPHSLINLSYAALLCPGREGEVM
jgi:hypothetical protein